MMVVASYGGGTNSTAMLIGMIERGEPAPHAILFADTGGEKPETYAYVETFSRWLAGNGFPSITVVRKSGDGLSLEKWCLKKRVLPSVAYGFKTCSQRYKLQPQEKWCNARYGHVWKAGEKVTRLVGFDADEPQRAKPYEDAKYVNRYPLIEWDWGRDECIEAIRRAGLDQPGKSACFFCPNNKPREIRELARQHPELAERALFMERNADHNTSVKGLGRDWRWADVLNQGEMFPAMYDRRPDMPCGCYDGEAA